MLITNIKCGNCGANLNLDDKEKTTVCVFCDSVFLVENILNANKDAVKKVTDTKIQYILPRHKKAKKVKLSYASLGPLWMIWPVALILHTVKSRKLIKRCDCILGFVRMQDKVHIDEIYKYFAANYPDAKKHDVVKLITDMLYKGNIVDYRFNVTEGIMEKFK